ncbi:MAG TPA: hypothetical protein VJ741_17105 [Solirubrobacteraceae bacterium]|nr:hypothetical protein [Solirubrobacteraceae bacterium]
MVAASLLCAAFVLGDRVGARHGATEIANAAPAAPARQAASPPSEQHAFPEHPLPYPPAQQATDIPPAFQRQLQQPPTVVLPPGQPAAPSSRSTRNAFGLEN